MILKVHGWMVCPFYPTHLEKIRQDAYQSGYKKGIEDGKRIELRSAVSEQMREVKSIIVGIREAFTWVRNG